MTTEMNNKRLADITYGDSHLETGVVTCPLAHPDEQIELLYTQARVALGAAFLVALVITSAIWGLVDHTLLLAWIGIQTIQTLVRAALVVATTGPANSRGRGIAG